MRGVVRSKTKDHSRFRIISLSLIFCVAVRRNISEAEIQNLSESIIGSFLSHTDLSNDYSSDFIFDLIYYLFIDFLIIDILKYVLSVDTDSKTD